MSNTKITTEMRRAAQAALAANGIQASDWLVDTVLSAGLAAAPQSPAGGQARTDADIVTQTEELAAALDRWRWGGVFEDVTYRNNNATRARHCWEMACKAQEILTDTDPENSVAEVDGAQGAEGGAA